MTQRALACLALLTLLSLPAQAQLNQTFNNLFDAVLVDALALSPGTHGSHFLLAASEADDQLTPGLNSLIASNISSFPLSTTVASITFDFSTGQPVPIIGSQGPIFAEDAITVGQRRFVVGFNATHLGLNSIRGLPLDEMRFTFLHEDVTQNGALGDNPNESDIIDIFLDLNVDANIYALFGTFGVLPNLDVSVAIPFIDIRMDGDARAVVQSFTFGALGQANHHFGTDATAPQLVSDQPYDESASGIGDIAVRIKWQLPLDSNVPAGLLLDIRLPTGDDANFLGTGSVSARGLLLLSRAFGDFTPHLNLGYDYRDAALDSDEVELIAGFDQRISESLTFAFDILAEFDLQNDEAIKLLPGMISIRDQVPNTSFTNLRDITRSNVPDQDHDHTLNASVGFKLAPSPRFQLLGNLLVPLQNDGLRSSVAPTFGAAFNF